ncbi:MAG: alpha/beta hydrolase, partial [Limnobacter sp.]|nr:alpha/beta hydrolase [Limnobacter sp.]
HGFAGAIDYYEKSSAQYFLGDIRVPTLMLHAMNDPFMPGQYLPKPLSLPPSVRCLFTQHGGHVGFATGRGPNLDLGWLPDICNRFFEDPEQFNGR